MPKPLQVGITGGIGSGKSLICAIFRTLGVPVYDADSHAKSLMTTDPVLVRQIKSEFGDAAYAEDGSLDRSYLSSATFGNKERLEKLNSLVHPRVAVDYSAWTNAHQQYAYLLREAALLYEAGAYRTVDKMIVVSAPEPIRIRRVLARDPQRTEASIQTIIANQWPESEKIARADFVIINDDEHLVIPQVLALHEKFLSQAVS